MNPADPDRAASTQRECAPGERVGALDLDRALLDWRGAQRRVDAYLRALGLDAGGVRRIGRQALQRALARDTQGRPASAAMDEIPRLLFEDASAPPGARVASAGGPARVDDVVTREDFLRWRLAAVEQGGVPRGEGPDPASFSATPPILRGSMVPDRFGGRRLGEWWRKRAGAARERPADPGREERRRARSAWSRRGRWRRFALSLLVLVPSVLAGFAFFATLPARIYLPAEIALATFFGALFGWISLGFWTALFGFGVLLRGGDRFAIARAEVPVDQPIDPDGRTAIVMPICDEPVDRVFAGLRATRDSLARTGEGAAFDFFVLSDSVDPDLCSDEVAAWAEWRRTAQDAGGGIFYRRRRTRVKRKSGNVADFCRRFGRRYRYMIVLDADSVMTGEALVRLVRLMESQPHVGAVQTAPHVVRARSAFARVQQFASGLYGPMFAAGMHYWQLGDSPYWGHNAILRVEPFMQHCALPRLSGSPPFGGDILSHDFVEAALLGRAGWSIWLAFDLPGSFEETPESLFEEMQRDQRWCQGNLQHLRLLFTRGLYTSHRALFLNGIFSYVSAVLWLGFLVASTVEAVMWSIQGPDYFPSGETLFPTWPVWRPERAGALFAVVFGVLMLPKALAVGLSLGRGQAARFGGRLALLRSVLLETLSSALFAPIRMAFYCRFVVLNLLGRAVSWNGGEASVRETSWLEALRRHGLDTAIAFSWSVCIYSLHPAAFWWFAPVAGALVLAVPLSVLASRAGLGDRARRAGWWATPEETAPPRELRELEAELAARNARPVRWSGFVGAVVDPLRNAVQQSLRSASRASLARIHATQQPLIERALGEGPAALDAPEKRLVLGHPRLLAELHERVWRLEDRELERAWRLGDDGESPTA